MITKYNTRGGDYVKLTPEQAQIVADNHNLIYWYCNMKKLDVNTYYDLLAIELCNTVMKYDPEKGTLANYFKIRADGMIAKEYQKSQAQKRAHKDIRYIENLYGVDNIYTNYKLRETYETLLGLDEYGIIKLRLLGYTQNEIAEMLNLSQSFISKELKRIRKEFNEIDR